MKHKFQAQIRFNDIDVLGHVNNTVYLSLYDLGKARYMEEAGLRSRGPEPPTCVIVDVHCTYLHPIFYGDEIYILTHCSDIGNKSFTLSQEMIDATGQQRSVCTTVMVYIDPATGRAAEIPDHFRSKLENYEAR